MSGPARQTADVSTDDSSSDSRRTARRRSVEATLLDRAPAAIVVTNRAGKIAYWNDEAETLYGWSREEVAGRDLLSLVTEQEDEADPAYDVFEGLADGRSWSGDLHLRDRQSGRVQVHFRGRPLIDSAGRQIGVVLVALRSELDDTADADLRARTDSIQTGRRIARARRQAGLTQEQLAGRIGVTKRSLQGYEAGTVAPYRHLRALAKVLGHDRAWFLGGALALEPATAAGDELAEVVRAAVREELRPVLRSLRGTRGSGV